MPSSQTEEPVFRWGGEYAKAGPYRAGGFSAKTRRQPLAGDEVVVALTKTAWQQAVFQEGKSLPDTGFRPPMSTR